MMLKKIVLVGFCFFALLQAQSTRIFGGTKVVQGDFAYIASLQIKQLQRNDCGVAFIANNWAVTAAHCFYNQLPRNLVSNVLDLNDTKNAVVWSVDEIIIHPNYDDKTFYNDIALLRVSNASNVVPQIIRFPSSDACVDLHSSDMLWVAGWGKTELGTGSFDLLKVALPLLSNEVAYQMLLQANVRGVSKIPAQVLMAGGEENKDSCQGDSGGPLVKIYEQNPYLVGIVSNGYGCGVKAVPAFYTRVSFFSDWIERISGVAPFSQPKTYSLNFNGDTQVSQQATYKITENPQNNPVSWQVSEHFKIIAQSNTEITVLVVSLGDAYITARDPLTCQMQTKTVYATKLALENPVSVKRSGCSKK
jgi:secreted trypsin-like serine protease